MLSSRLHALQTLREQLSDIPQDILYQAEAANPWFTQAFIQEALKSIRENYLHEAALEAFSASLPPENNNPKTVGLVMAGNIPLVGFHDVLCVYLSGHKALMKASGSDTILMTYVIDALHNIDPQSVNQLQWAERLKNCDAYIATGSNTSAGHFDYYFGKYPNIIRRNRTSVAILDGTETQAELEALADDVYVYFGLGCRNITHICVPSEYNFEPLLQVFRKYDALKDHNKYRNNYDYQLALYILNGQFYMSNDSLLLVENAALFSPVAVLHYSFYNNAEEVKKNFESNSDIQALVGHYGIPFGSAQKPQLNQFADGVNTLEFLKTLN